MAPQKLSQEKVNYRPREESGVGWLKNCGDCTMFQAPAVPPYSGSCSLVKGEIDPNHVCDEWAGI